MMPPQKDIDWALSVELNLKESERAEYLIYLNNRPMSERINTKEARDIRDGCILTGLFIRRQVN